jgi:hypothetical protein
MADAGKGVFAFKSLEKLTRNVRGGNRTVRRSVRMCGEVGGSGANDQSVRASDRRQQDTHLWLFLAPSFSSSASASGHG